MQLCHYYSNLALTQTSSYLVLVGSLKQGILSTWHPKIVTHLKLLRDVSKVDGHPRSQYHLLSCLFIDGPVFFSEGLI